MLHVFRCSVFEYGFGLHNGYKCYSIGPFVVIEYHFLVTIFSLVYFFSGIALVTYVLSWLSFNRKHFPSQLQPMARVGYLQRSTYLLERQFSRKRERHILSPDTLPEQPQCQKCYGPKRESGTVPASR